MFLLVVSPSYCRGYLFLPQLLSQIESNERKEAKEEMKKAKRLAKQAHGSAKKSRKASKVRNNNKRALEEKKMKEIDKAKSEAYERKQWAAVKKSRCHAKDMEDEGPVYIRGGAGNNKKGGDDVNRMRISMTKFLTKDIKAKPKEAPGSRMLECPYGCGRTFAAQQGLSIHITTHEAKGDKLKPKKKNDGKVKLLVTTPRGSKKRVLASELESSGVDAHPPNLMSNQRSSSAAAPRCRKVLQLSSDDEVSDDSSEGVDKPLKRPKLGYSSRPLTASAGRNVVDSDNEGKLLPQLIWDYTVTHIY